MKVKLTVDLLRDNNTSVLTASGGAIVKTAATHSEAKALVDTEVASRVAAAAGAAQELADAQVAFNS